MPADLPPRLERIKDILVCPDCGGTLGFKGTVAECTSCEKIYSVKNNKIYFIPVPEHDDELDKLKDILRRILGKYYYSVGIDLVAPTYPFNFRKQILKRLDPARQTVVDVGSGNRRLDENIICLDVFDLDEVDIVCDLAKLPFRRSSVDAFVSRSVLEHLPKPWAIADMLTEKTRPGGLGLHLIPFLFPFHASPDDYARFTYKGVGSLFDKCDIIEQKPATGPVSLFLINFIEFMSILLSFGHSRLKSYVYLFFCAIMFPLKFIDIFFVNKKSFLTMCPTIFSVMRRRDEAADS